jgi:transposase
LAADFLPPVWLPDAQTAALRRQVWRRAHIVRQRTRLKNQVHPILHRNLVPRCPASDLFGIKGRHCLADQLLPPDEKATATALLRQLDFQGAQLSLIDADLARIALGRDDVHRLMSIPGVDAIVALSIVAAIGEVTRFRSPDKLVCYFGLNPRVRQSGGNPASHGRITKAGPGHARGMLVEAAWAAAKTPGPLRAFYQRVRSAARHANRRGRHRPQTRRAVLAPDDQRRELRLRPTLAARLQAPQTPAARRPTARQRTQRRFRGLFPQGRPCR